MQIVVLAGGNSTERDISIISGSGITRALRAKGHRAVLLDVCSGAGVSPADPFPEVYDVDQSALAIRGQDEEVRRRAADPHADFVADGVIGICRKADFVFLALHGANGEDGRLQAMLDLMRIRYTGSGYLGCAVSMDKNLTKETLRAGGVCVPRGFSLDRSTRGRAEEMRRTSGIGFPLVVKVNHGGSSVGVYIVREEAAYAEAVEEAFALEDTILVEEYIAGREFSVGVIDGRALPVIEIAPKEGFYDYKNKYTAGATVETCPAMIPDMWAAGMKASAEAGFRLLQLSAYARFDFIVTKNGEAYCLEANPLPGMTPTSLLPQEAAAEGVSFPDLCELLIEVSRKKY